MVTQCGQPANGFLRQRSSTTPIQRRASTALKSQYSSAPKPQRIITQAQAVTSSSSHRVSLTFENSRHVCHLINCRLRADLLFSAVDQCVPTPLNGFTSSSVCLPHRPRYAFRSASCRLMFLLLGWNILLLGWNILLLGWNIPCKLASKGRHPSRTIRVGRHLRPQLPDPTVASVTGPHPRFDGGLSLALVSPRSSLSACI